MIGKVYDDYTAYNLNQLANILKYASKQKDGEDMALLIARKYGTLDRCFAATVEELEALVGKKAATFIKVLASVTSRRITDSFEFGKIQSAMKIGEYFSARLISESVEVVLAMYLDENGIPVSSRIVGEGTVNMSDITARRILEGAVDTGCKRVIIAHNHPKGIAKASEEDTNMTAKLARTLMRAGVTLEYHLVVSGVECDTVDFDVK